MHDADFKAFRTQVFTLYAQKAYADALALIEHRATNFKAFESDLYYWRACLSGAMGDRTAALGWLQQAADAGYWYHERILSDPDLTVLRETAELAQLQAVFQERFERAQAQSRPQRQAWQPAGTPKGVLLALHGASGSIRTDGGLWRPAADLGWRVALAQSSQLWAPGNYHWVDFATATAELRQHLAELGPAGYTALGGMSMGAGVAIRAVLSGSVAAQGFLAVAPAFRTEDVVPLIATADRSVRGYIVVGKLDSLYQRALDLATAMRAAGLQCTVEEHPGLSHDYPPEFTASLQQGLSFLPG